MRLSNTCHGSELGPIPTPGSITGKRKYDFLDGLKVLING